MIPQKDLQKTTGYVHGANNPVGIRQKHNFPIYIDHSAQDAGFHVNPVIGRFVWRSIFVENTSLLLHLLDRSTLSVGIDGNWNITFLEFFDMFKVKWE